MPDEQGIVRFDYSIFEKKKRETSEYNLNTCELYTPDRGYNEFGVVMNMIMVMQEAYSEEHCYFMYEDEPDRVEGYALLIGSVLGIHLKFPNRSRMWDMLLFFKNTKKYQNVTAKMVWDVYAIEFCDYIPEQFLAVLCIDFEEAGIPDEPFEGEKSEIKTVPQEKLLYYVYQQIKSMVDNKGEEELKEFLQKLLDADLPGRQELAKGDKYGMIAEVSLYVLPPVIVRGYAWAVQLNFRDAWEKLGIKGYTEIITEKRNKKTETSQEDTGYFPFYKAIRRDCEDEFVEFWMEEALYFSDNMKKCLSDWKARFMEINPGEDFDMETVLTQIITDLDREWHCRLTDQRFVIEFMAHREDMAYKKAALLCSHFMNQEACYFPELTRKQAIRWVIRNNRCSFDFTAMSALPALLVNHRHRYEVFGF